MRQGSWESHLSGQWRPFIESHQRADCSANRWAPTRQENDKNQHWTCLCSEKCLWNPTCVRSQHFSPPFPLLLLQLPLGQPHPTRSPFCLYFLTVYAVLHLPSARVRGQLSQQCLYCVAHMEKITTARQFSPWSYVNSFDGMSGLSPICDGMGAWGRVEGSGGTAAPLILTLCISNPFVNHVSRKLALIAVILTVMHPQNDTLTAQSHILDAYGAVTALGSPLIPVLLFEAEARVCLPERGALCHMTATTTNYRLSGLPKQSDTAAVC